MIEKIVEYPCVKCTESLQQTTRWTKKAFLLLHIPSSLRYFRSNSHIIEKAITHGKIRVGVMTWRSDRKQEQQGLIKSKKLEIVFIALSIFSSLIDWSEWSMLHVLLFLMESLSAAAMLNEFILNVKSLYQWRKYWGCLQTFPKDFFRSL